MKRPTADSIKARFIHVVTTSTDSIAWNYSRMGLDDAVECFNALGLVGYQLVAKDAVKRDTAGRVTKTTKAPGIFFKVLEK